MGKLGTTIKLLHFELVKILLLWKEQSDEDVEEVHTFQIKRMGI